MKKKIIQVPIPQELLAEVDAVALEKGESRAAFIREACITYIARSREEALQQRYIEGYLRFPESADEAEALEKLAVNGLEPEEW